MTRSAFPPPPSSRGRLDLRPRGGGARATPLRMMAACEDRRRARIGRGGGGRGFGDHRIGEAAEERVQLSAEDPELLVRLDVAADPR